MDKRKFLLLGLCLMTLFMGVIVGCASNTGGVLDTPSPTGITPSITSTAVIPTNTSTVVSPTATTVTSTPDSANTEVPPTVTPTQVTTVEAHYWTVEEITDFLHSYMGLFSQFFWDPELPDKDDPMFPDNTLTAEFVVQAGLDGRQDEVFQKEAEFIQALSEVPSDYICEQVYLWFVQGYGFLFDGVYASRESMLPRIYQSVIADPNTEPSCPQFFPENEEETLRLVEEYK